MRLLLILTSLLALIWSGYWIVFSVKLKSEVSDFLESYNSEERLIDYSNISIKGFPNRFDITVNELNIKNENSKINWFLPYFQILSLSYKPNHLILVFPNTQILQNGKNKIIFNSNEMLASLSFMDYKFSELDQFILSIENSEIKASERIILNTTALNFAIKQSKTLEGDYHLGFRGNNIKLNTTETNSEYKLLENNLNLVLHAEITLEELYSFSNKKMPKIKTLNIKALDLKSSNFNVTGTGKAFFNNNILEDGILNIKIENWRSFFNTPLQNNGKFKLGLELIETITGNDEILDLNLKIEDGNVYLGPVFIGSLENMLKQ